MDQTYDLLIIGSGSAGLTAAGFGVATGTAGGERSSRAARRAIRYNLPRDFLKAERRAPGSERRA